MSTQTAAASHRPNTRRSVRPLGLESGILILSRPDVYDEEQCMLWSPDVSLNHVTQSEAVLRTAAAVSGA